MKITNKMPWNVLERWNSKTLVIAGIGSLTVVAISVLELAVYGQRFEVVPEWGLAVIVIPTMFATLIGLLGFYPLVSEASPWLARGGAAGAAVGIASFLVTVVGGAILHLLGIVGFTEEGNPLILASFSLMFIGLLLSFLLYGIASVLTRRPSRLVGVFLLIPLVEPLSVFIIDMGGVEIPGGPLTTLAVEGIALIVVGYLIWADTEPADSVEPAVDSTA